jgi:hypothetical protein
VTGVIEGDILTASSFLFPIVKPISSNYCEFRSGLETVYDRSGMA